MVSEGYWAGKVLEEAEEEDLDVVKEVVRCTPISFILSSKTLGRFEASHTSEIWTFMRNMKKK